VNNLREKSFYLGLTRIIPSFGQRTNIELSF
jgi:hypothetical protein